MPTSMMITNRNVEGTGLGNKRYQLRCYVSEKASLNSLANWTELSREEFRDRLIQIAGQFSQAEESAIANSNN